MKYGIREICDVVLRQKQAGWFGKLYLEKNSPVIYFDTLKTSSLEGASETVYAQGGAGNPRLVAWEGDRTVTFTMEDALISPESFSVLSGAGFLDATKEEPVYVHATEQVEVKAAGGISLENVPASDHEDAAMYIMLMTDDGLIDPNKIPLRIATPAQEIADLQAALDTAIETYNTAHADLKDFKVLDAADYKLTAGSSVVYVDYYVKSESGVKQIDIEANKFGGTYYLEASTLWRDQANGVDYPAEFVIPKCKVQSNFTFTMAPTGDPSTFTFTMDAFPDYTKFNKTKKVIAAIQIVEDKDNFGK